MGDFQLDGRRWRFLDSPSRYLEHETGGLFQEPLARQFKTAKEILKRFVEGRGVLLADDVGLGKTTVGALVAWAIACQDKRVRIYAPNEVLRTRWAEELERHIPMLEYLGASKDRIKQGDVGKLNAGRIQIATHHALVKSHDNEEQRTACDLMIIDEAHRAKGDGSAFNEALHNLGDRALRKLILTATPFSIRISELEQLLGFCGARDLKPVRAYAEELKRLYALGEGHDVATESHRLVGTARAAIEAMAPFVIRHGIDDLSASERTFFGTVSPERWEMAATSATTEDLSLLLRMDRLLQLVPERNGERRNDPRFHIGWQHVGTELQRAEERTHGQSDHAAVRHIKLAKKALIVRRAQTHPKISAVSGAILPLVSTGEKVVIFCHHRATAGELLVTLERSLRVASTATSGPSERVWREAWKSVLPEGELVDPIVEWFCTTGLRRQVAGWLGDAARESTALAGQLETVRPRHTSKKVPTIAEAANTLTKMLLDEQSTSTRAVLKAIAKGRGTFGSKLSHFPGRLDEGYRVMGAWHHDHPSQAPLTLYTGRPDIVLAIFNSPFGPDVLVATDRLSEGVDMHRCCRHLIHYELDPSPVRTLQRNGRIRRVGSWASLTGQAIRYAYPTFGGTRDEKAVGVMRQRINAFGMLLGGVPKLDDESSDNDQKFAEMVLRDASKELQRLNRRLGVE